MKKIIAWVNIMAILGVDGIMQDQNDTTVNFMGEHVEAIEAKLAEHAVKKAEWKAKKIELEAAVATNSTAATKVTELTAQIADLTTKLTAATTLAGNQATEIADLNAKLALRPEGNNPGGGGGGGADAKVEFANKVKTLGHNVAADKALKAAGHY